MTSVDELARQLDDIRRRLAAVERTAQAPRTSIDGGALVVNDADGNPLVVIGDQGDGTAGVAAVNGAVVRADTVPQETLDEIAASLALADGAVTEALIAAGAVTTTKVADDAISTPKIVAGAVQTAQIAAGAVAAGKIAANAVTANTIAANAVTAAAIAAGSITADRLAIGTTGASVIPDPSFESAGLRAARLASGTAWRFDTGSATARGHGDAYAYVDGDGTNFKQLWLTEPLPTKAGERFTGEMMALAATGTNGVLALSYEATVQGGTLAYGPVISATATTAWTTQASTAPAVMPAGAVSVRFFLQTVGQTTGRWAADNVAVRRVVLGVEIADGAITASKIATNAVTTDALAAGSVTAAQLAADAITGKTITGGVFRTAQSGKRLEIGETTYSPTGDASLWWNVGGGNIYDQPYIAADNLPEVRGGKFIVIRSGIDGGRRTYVYIQPDRFSVQADGAYLYLSESGLILGGSPSWLMDVRGSSIFADGRLTSDMQTAPCTAITTPTSTTPVAVTGASLPVTTKRAGARYLALWTADAELTTAGAATVSVRCLAGATVLSREAIVNFSNVAVGGRATVSQFVPGTLGAAGTYTFALQAARATGSGVARLNATHTALTVIVFE